MSIDLKHYVAIGLGLAVVAGFAMQKSTAPKQSAAFQAPGEFRPLSSFELATEPPPSFAAKVQPLQIPDKPVIRPVIEQVATVDVNQNETPIGQQVAFDSGDSADPSVQDYDLQVPSFVEFEDAAPVTTGPLPTSLPDAELQASVENSPEEIDKGLEQAFVSAFVAVDPDEASAQIVTRNAELPNSRWNSNPFVDQANQAIGSTAIASTNVQPAETETRPQVTASLPILDNSIIVEPPADNSFDARMEDLATTKTPDPRAISSTEPLPSGGNDFPMMSDLPTKQLVMNQPIIDSSVDKAWQAEVNSQPKTQTEHPLARTTAGKIVPREIPLSDSAAQQAVHHIEYGKSLSRRGAAFAARQEFYTALRVLAQANDETANDNRFSRSLSQAILAMKEAKDFVNHNSESELLLDVSSITELHRSQIIGSGKAKSTSAAMAMESYYQFACNKLDEAGGRNAVAVEALYCLGKLHTSVSKSTVAPKKSDVIRAITYHEAALLGDPNNYRSANELGVLLVRMGELEPAVEMFKRSLIARQTPQGWQNLAKTHERLGQPQLAQLAVTEFSRLAKTSVTSSPDSIQWLSNQSFNANAPQALRNQSRVADMSNPPGNPPKTTAEKFKAKSSSFSRKLKDLF